MNNKRLNILTFLALTVALLFSACQQPGNDSTGSEYMPDMAHSIAMEANTYNYYYWNTWDKESVISLKTLSMPRNPVAGTVPRGYAGVHYASTTTAKNAEMSHFKGEGAIQSISIPVNGSVPYYYKDTEEERTRAMTEIIYNPFPITNNGLSRGKVLYDVYCGICHGEKGDGNGYIVREDGGVYPAAPANLLTDVFVSASNGRYYHAIIYGKNVMGGYADKLSYEERWQVIHHIRALQAQEKKLVYNEESNTLNSIDVPGKTVAPMAISETTTDMDESHEKDSQGGDHSGTDHNEGNH